MVPLLIALLQGAPITGVRLSHCTISHDFTNFVVVIQYKGIVFVNMLTELWKKG